VRSVAQSHHMPSRGSCRRAGSVSSGCGEAWKSKRPPEAPRVRSSPLPTVRRCGSPTTPGFGRADLQRLVLRPTSRKRTVAHLGSGFRKTFTWLSGVKPLATNGVYSPVLTGFLPPEKQPTSQGSIVPDARKRSVCRRCPKRACRLPGHLPRWSTVRDTTISPPESAAPPSGDDLHPARNEAVAKAPRFSSSRVGAV
jgi:hypothetical protein